MIEHHEHKQRKAVIDQLAAVRSAIDRASRIVLDNRVESCLRGAASNGMADVANAREASR